MSFEGGEVVFGGDSLQNPMDRVVQDCRDTLESLRSILRRKKSRSTSIHTVDDAAFDLRISKEYRKAKIISPKLNERGHEMLGPDWEAN